MTNDYLSHFKFIGHGTWVNDELDACVTLDEDYKRTFRAYLSNRPHPYTVITSPKGAATRFRSAEAAAKHLFGERGEFRRS